MLVFITFTFKSKIVGGTVTEVNEYASMVGLIYRPSGSLFCGGAISKYNLYKKKTLLNLISNQIKINSIVQIYYECGTLL